jgi:hypothetical protein
VRRHTLPNTACQHVNARQDKFRLPFRDERQFRRRLAIPPLFSDRTDWLFGGTASTTVPDLSTYGLEVKIPFQLRRSLGFWYSPASVWMN